MKVSCAERLNKALSIKNMTQSELCKKTGIPKSAMSQYVNGSFEPKQDRIYLIAKALNVAEAWLMGYDVPMQAQSKTNISLKHPDVTEDIVTFPVIGEIAAGYDTIGVEDWSGETVDIPTSYLGGRKKEEFFVLTVHGDSMYPLYLDGDKVLILKQNTLNRSGEIGAIIYNNEFATLKKIEYVMGEDWLEMLPLNPEYKPKRIEGVDLELCRIIGIPQLLIRKM